MRLTETKAPMQAKSNNIKLQAVTNSSRIEKIRKNNNCHTFSKSFLRYSFK